MIWYLLYPFRGTTEPPKLAPQHPLRRAFLRYGSATARHWLFSIILSVAFASLLCYPVLFLSTDSHVLPHHVWASARFFDDDASLQPDVELRQVWVHGSYMNAINKDVLGEALKIQDALIGSALTEHGSNRSHNPMRDHHWEASGSRYKEAHVDQAGVDFSWGFHSPLMYWNCSHDIISADDDLLETINHQVNRRSFLKFTLRPASVFAGKRFYRQKLQAADALVITLISRRGSGAGREWDERSRELARTAASRGWFWYPEAGVSTGSQVFQFRIEPMSLSEDFVLAGAYAAMAIYVLVSLRKLRAVKSRFGLLVTVITQITISLLASLTVCGILQINLARIPREAYPFVVLVMGLENMFRLINAVLANPAAMPTPYRVAHALADVGHLSLAATGQNLFLLWALSRLVSPGVTAFCAFAAVALVFDFVFLLTFFVAVLSVDVRRLELQDSLDKVNNRSLRSKSPSPKAQTWAGALLQGNLPFSTRIAGSAVTICFILALNWHFFDSEQQGRGLAHRLGLRQHPDRIFMDPPSLPKINQARTPSAWLKLQGQDNAREILGFAQPKTAGFTSRIYDPLIVVTKDADRSGAPSTTMSIVTWMQSLVDEHIFPFALAVVFIIAAVTLLMNYLLWTGLPDGAVDHQEDEEPGLAIKSLPRIHGLDIVKLSSCGKGQIISVSLDRRLCMWYLDPHSNVYSHTLIHPALLNPPLWPIVSCAAGECGRWLGVCTNAGNIGLWNFKDQRFTRFARTNLQGSHPAAMIFAAKGPDDPSGFVFIVVSHEGTLTEVDLYQPDAPPFSVHRISQAPILSATVLMGFQETPRVISIHRNGEATLTVRDNKLNSWTSVKFPSFKPRLTQEGKLSRVRHIVHIRQLGLYAAVRSFEVDLFDSPTNQHVHTFSTNQIKGQSLRFVQSEPRVCNKCRHIGAHFLSLVYTDAGSDACVMQTYAIGQSTDSIICLRPTTDGEEHDCRTFEHCSESIYTVASPGTWEATGSQAIIGIRRHPPPGDKSPPATSTGTDTSSFSSVASVGLKKRALVSSSHNSGPTSVESRDTTHLGSLSKAAPARHSQKTTRDAGDTHSEAGDWEMWTLSVNGEIFTVPLSLNGVDESSVSEKFWTSHDGTNHPQEGELYAVAPGPIAPLGKRSVVVGLGNSIRIITNGNERFERNERAGERTNLKWRRKAANLRMP